MKKLSVLLCVFLIALIATVYHRRGSAVHEDFALRARAASGALFVNEQGGRKMICSGSVFGYDKQGDALFVTAKHCVYEPEQKEDPEWGTPATPAKFIGHEEVSFSDNEAGPYYLAVPLAISKGDDIAVLTLKNGFDLPCVPVGDEHRLSAGDTLLNYSFALSLGKMALPFRAVEPEFNYLPTDILLEAPDWAFTMPVDGTAAPGSSGSALYDPKQRALVGIVVGMASAGGPKFAEPASRIRALLSDHSLWMAIPEKAN